MALLHVLEVTCSFFHFTPPPKKKKIQENVTQKEQNSCPLFAFRAKLLVIKATG